MKHSTTCSESDCDRPFFGRGYCARHLSRLRSRGRIRKRTETERFWEKVEKTENCWNWTASLRGDGYAQFFRNGQIPCYGHRWVYEHTIGPIPDGLFLDHLCRNRRCVNPWHLEPVTKKVNSLRGLRKPYCKRGHRFDGDNVIWSKDRRQCRKCRNDRQRFGGSRLTTRPTASYTLSDRPAD